MCWRSPIRDPVRRWSPTPNWSTESTSSGTRCATRRWPAASAPTTCLRRKPSAETERNLPGVGAGTDYHGYRSWETLIQTSGHAYPNESRDHTYPKLDHEQD